MTDDKSVKETILLVDDNATNLQVLLQTLKPVGCSLLVAKDGEKALSIVHKSHPDLILLDIMMPGIDGFEVCRRLKADPATAAIPVIFLSALDETSDKVKGLQLGAVDYVPKPFQAEEVIARVNTHLTIHRLSREVQNQRDQIEHELQVTSELQQDLLPATLPQIDGLKLGVHYETSRFAGGDYYDIAQLPDNNWGFLVADAEGHSAPAAVMMAMTCALFRSCTDLQAEPNKVLDYINSNLCKVNEDSFVTAIYVVYNADHRTIKIARSGHPLPMIYRSTEDKATELECKGVIPLGYQPYDHVPMTEFQLEKGDRLLLYTDGITERFNIDDEQYGEKRLLSHFGTPGPMGPQEILKSVMDDLEGFAAGRPADDDQALFIGIVE
ncbi:SpoIIE family protein phosphatase [Thermodesulfobacteriota bacterium]